MSAKEDEGSEEDIITVVGWAEEVTSGDDVSMGDCFHVRHVKFIVR